MKPITDRDDWAQRFRDVLTSGRLVACSLCKGEGVHPNPRDAYVWWCPWCNGRWYYLLKETDHETRPGYDGTVICTVMDLRAAIQTLKSMRMGKCELLRLSQLVTDVSPISAHDIIELEIKDRKPKPDPRWNYLNLRKERY